MTRKKNTKTNRFPVFVKIALVLLLLVICFIGYNLYINSSDKSKPATIYEGTYIGNTGQKTDLVDIKITVLKKILTGTATFKGTASGYKLVVPIDIKGAILDNGQVAASLNGVGYSYDQPFNLSGSTSGLANGNNITLNYSFTLANQKFENTVTLKNKP